MLFCPVLTCRATDSEPAYFWYQSQVRTEANYLIAEALPDWKHKATKIARECVRQGISLDPDTARTGVEAEFARWFATLKDEVEEWKKVAEASEVPDFDLAVADLLNMLAQKTTQSVAGADLEDEGLRRMEKVDSGFGP